MPNRKGQGKKKARGGKRLTPIPMRGLSVFLEDVRQCAYPRELRILLPADHYLSRKLVSEAVLTTQPLHQPELKGLDASVLLPALVELANCLWYLRTRHFGREWHDENSSADDPRTRRALGRLNKGASALKRLGLEVEDPTGKRYPSGGEAMMRPIDFIPMLGLTYEKVTEATAPLVYWNDRVIQRAEVFVAVPATTPDSAPLGRVPSSGSQEPSPGDGDNGTSNHSDSSRGTGEPA